MKVRAVLDESGKSVDGTVTVRADKLELTLDTTDVARQMAEAGARALSDAIRASGGQASPGTIRKRRAQGISSTKSWFATGKLADGIEIRQTADGAYEVSAPPGYLQDTKVFARFEQEILNAIGERTERSVADAVEHAVDASVKVVRRG